MHKEFVLAAVLPVLFVFWLGIYSLVGWQERKQLEQRYVRFLMIVGVLVTLGAAAVMIETIKILRAGQLPVDFNTFYLAGRMVAQSPASIYDPVALDTLEKTAERTGSPYQVGLWSPPFAYPPFFAVLLRPLAGLPYTEAAWIWIALDTVFVLLSVGLLLSLAGWSIKSMAGWCTVLLVLIFYAPAHEVIFLGQIGPPILFLTVAALVLLRRGGAWRDGLAGALLGLAVGIKIFPAVLLIYLLLRRRWAAVAGGAAAFVTTLLVGIIGTGWGMAGWALNWDYFTVRLFGTYVARFGFLHPGNQSLTALFIRPLGDTPLAQILGLGVVGLIFCATWLFFVRRRTATPAVDRLLPEYALVSLLPLLVPSGIYSHSYILALLPLTILAAVAVNRLPVAPLPGLRPGLAVAYLLLILSCYAEWTYWPVFYYIPFGLIGILILWGYLLAICLRTSRNGANQLGVTSVI